MDAVAMPALRHLKVVASWPKFAISSSKMHWLLNVLIQEVAAIGEAEISMHIPALRQ